jgi:hypothetical protein
MKKVKLFEQFINEALNPKKHMYGVGSAFRKYATDLSELEGEAAAAYKKYSKYIGKSIEFNQHTDTYDGVPKEIADGGSKDYHFRPEAFEILDVTIITDLDKFHPFVSASPKKMEKKGYENFLVGMVVAVRDSVTHTAEISAPPVWFEKNVKFK